MNLDRGGSIFDILVRDRIKRGHKRKLGIKKRTRIGTLLLVEENGAYLTSTFRLPFSL